MQCRDFREIADSYLSDELLIETNHDVIRHLESCADCRRELAARRELRSKLREGFQDVTELQMRAEFAGILKSQLRETALRRRPSMITRATQIAIAASLVIAAALGFRVVQHRWPMQSPPDVAVGPSRDTKGNGEKRAGQPAFLSALLTESAVGDHRNCAIAYRLEERPIDLDEAGRKYDRAYINLVSAIMSEGILPAGAELVTAHSCVFKGQRFGHVILKYHGQLVSILVMKSESKDQSASVAEPLIASAQTDGYESAQFQTARHAVFVVSALSDNENLAIAQAIAPSVSRHIQRTERVV